MHFIGLFYIYHLPDYHYLPTQCKHWVQITIELLTKFCIICLHLNFSPSAPCSESDTTETQANVHLSKRFNDLSKTV